MLAAIFLLACVVSQTEETDRQQGDRYLAQCDRYKLQLESEIIKIEKEEGKRSPTIKTLQEFLRGYPDSGAVPFVDIAYPLGKGEVVPGDFGFLLNSFEVRQIIDENEMIIETDGDQLLWVKGIPTLKFIEGKSFEPPVEFIFDAIGQQQYKTVIGGTKTIVLLQAINSKMVIQNATKQLARQLEEKKRDKIAARDRRRSATKGMNKPASEDDKKASEIRLKMGAARSKLAVNDRDAAEKFAREAVKLAEGTDLADQAEKLLEEIANPGR